MLAVILNSVLIIVGTLIGLVFRKLIKPELTNSILKVLGIVVFITGLMGIIKAMIVVENGILKSNFDLFLLVVIVLDVCWWNIKIDTHLNNFGKYLDTKFNSGKISEGFITGTIIYISGAMGMVGSINAALGDSTILFWNPDLMG